MTISQEIRRRRLAKGLTQEQVATALGISAPAVNKWEKGVSYPDITLLGALARLLDTDVNALLGFESQPSPERVGQLSSQLALTAQQEGVSQALSGARALMRQYPNSPLLALNVALTLEGAAALLGAEEDPALEDEAARLYRQAADGADSQVASHARAMLAARHTRRGEYGEAARILNALPDESAFDKKQMQAQLELAQGRIAQAALIEERHLLSLLSGVQPVLSTLLDVAVKEDRQRDAGAIARILDEFTALFGLWPGGACAGRFELALARRDAEACLESLNALLRALKEDWSFAESPLYRHLPTKEGGVGRINAMLLDRLAEEFSDPGKTEYDFLRARPEFAELLAQMANARGEERG